MNARFNELEYATLMTAAAAVGMSVTAYVATAAVAVAREEVSPAPVDFKERMRTLSDARIAVNRIGTNLNQIAAVLNSEGEETPERLAAVLERVERAVRSLDEATIAVMEGRA
ncbi:plasmid mobilization relaxosome protein MobC [Streptomyces sp. PKU-EA00015]|nr:plasmid mobilization relaxosome protein MobC [Streptomyces sp. PKU-EA00015]NWF30864.1 plasmid mobilization relaxosome protein MobC [Streptomyces sp. PKU-EA00015]